MVTNKRAEFRREGKRSQVFEYFEKIADEKLKMSLGMIVTIPSTMPGSSKYQRELMITVSNKLGHPDLFITFTGNPKWPEIVRACEKLHCNWADIPEYVNEVFYKKSKMFLEDVCGKKVKSSEHHARYIRQPGMFGQLRWYNYSVEFQQKGMPHIHLLLSLEKPITTAADIDNIVKAEVPPMPSKSDPNFEKVS